MVAVTNVRMVADIKVLSKEHGLLLIWTDLCTKIPS